MAGKFIFNIPSDSTAVPWPEPPPGRPRGIALTVNDTLFSDSSGRRIVVHTPFRRIISLYGAHTENLYAMGAGDQVIGVGSNDEWPPEVRSKPVHSYHDDLEKFLAVQPDLILLRPMIDRGYGQLIRQLEGHGVRVVSLQPSSMDQMFVYWQILGLLTGRQEAARGMTAHFKETMNRTRRLTAAIPEKKAGILRGHSRLHAHFRAHRHARHGVGDRRWHQCGLRRRSAQGNQYRPTMARNAFCPMPGRSMSTWRRSVP